MSVEAGSRVEPWWVWAKPKGKEFNMGNNRKCMPPGTNRGATYTWN